jgi:hypothetical protein
MPGGSSGALTWLCVSSHAPPGPTRVPPRCRCFLYSAPRPRCHRPRAPVPARRPGCPAASVALRSALPPALRVPRSLVKVLLMNLADSAIFMRRVGGARYFYCTQSLLSTLCPVLSVPFRFIGFFRTAPAARENIATFQGACQGNLNDIFTIVITSTTRHHYAHFRLILSYTLHVAGRPGPEAITVLRSLT